jgi:hypothetical protein
MLCSCIAVDLGLVLGDPRYRPTSRDSRELSVLMVRQVLTLMQWKYAQMALTALTHMRSREIIPPAAYARYLTNCTIHTHPTIRSGGRKYEVSLIVILASDL